MSKKVKVDARTFLNQSQEEGASSILTSSQDNENQTDDSAILKLLNAEEVTKMATDFLKELGNKKATPTKVAQEGVKHYIVEVGLKNKSATVVIDASAKEIKEFEINALQKTLKTPVPSLFSPKIILVICGIQVLLMILFNLLTNFLSLPFL